MHACRAEPGTSPLWLPLQSERPGILDTQGLELLPHPEEQGLREDINDDMRDDECVAGAGEDETGEPAREDSSSFSRERWVRWNAERDSVLIGPVPARIRELPETSWRDEPELIRGGVAGDFPNPKPSFLSPDPNVCPLPPASSTLDPRP